jgi:predicted ATPase
VSVPPARRPETAVPQPSRRLSRRFRAASGRALLDALKELFRGNRILLVLDNFEHVLAASHAVQELLTEVPSLKILATSREPMGIDPEHVVDLPSLPSDLAVPLFVSRAAEHTSAPPSPDDPHVKRLCERLDCLPLAIELVAPRTQLYPVRDLLATIEPSILDVTRRQRSVPERQRSLRAAIEWSYARLSDSEKRLFRELSVFAGGCTIQTAALAALSRTQKHRTRARPPATASTTAVTAKPTALCT